AGAEPGDLVVQVAAGDRVLHQVLVWPDPDDLVVRPGRDAVPGCRNRDVAGLERAAVGDELLADRAVTGHQGASCRPQAVGADDRAALVAAAVSEPDPRRAAVVAEPGYFAAGLQGDAILRPARLVQHGQQVTAVHDAVGVAIAALERRAEVHGAEMPAGVGVHEHQAAGMY